MRNYSFKSLCLSTKVKWGLIRKQPESLRNHFKQKAPCCKQQKLSSACNACLSLLISYTHYVKLAMKAQYQDK